MFYLSAKADYNLSVGKISSFAYNNKNRAHFVFKQKIHRARPKAERIEGGAKRGAPPTFAIGSEFEFFDKRSQIGFGLSQVGPGCYLMGIIFCPRAFLPLR